MITLPWKILCRRGDNLHIVCTTLCTCVHLFNIFRFELCLLCSTVLCTFEKNSFQLSLSTKYMYSFQDFFSSLCIQGEGYQRVKGYIELTCCCTGRSVCCSCFDLRRAVCTHVSALLPYNPALDELVVTEISIG